MKKTQKTLQNVKKSHLLRKIATICAIFLLILFLFGCAKHTDPIDTIADAAHQQIVAIKESLPKECQTKAIDEQLKAHDTTVESIVSNCNTQKEALNAEKLRWKWAFLATVIMIAAYIARKVMK